MNNTGSAEAPPVSPAGGNGVRLPLRLLLLGAGALLLALIIGSQVIGVLSGVLFPPPPPLPAGSVEISHQSEAHGVDEWLYWSSQTPCDVLTHYVEAGGDCRVAPSACQNQDDGASSAPSGSPGEHVARCTGLLNFSIFPMRWQVIIAHGADPTRATEFRLVREVLWTGAPLPTPTVG